MSVHVHVHVALNANVTQETRTRVLKNSSHLERVVILYWLKRVLDAQPSSQKEESEDNQILYCGGRSAEFHEDESPANERTHLRTALFCVNGGALPSEGQNTKLLRLRP